MTRSDDRALAVEWARGLLNQADFVILDCETTGLRSDAEIVSVAIIAPSGQVLLDQLVKPTRSIPSAAIRIHSITDAMVAGAPTFAEVAPLVRELVSGITVVTYNADFDERMLEQSARAHRLTYEVPIFGVYKYDCAMLQYAQFIGQWSGKRGSYLWHPLIGGDHTALGDARACLALLQRMARG